MFTELPKAAAKDRSRVKRVHHMRFRSCRSDALNWEFAGLEDCQVIERKENLVRDLPSMHLA